MHTRIRLAVAFFGCATFAVAKPAPEETKATPISAANASQVRPVREVPKVANRILRGPGRGELLLFDRKGPAEVVDDVALRLIRPLLKDQAPSDVAIGACGKLLAWTGRGKSGYTVHGADGKAFDVEIGEHPGRAAFSPNGKLLAIGFTFWDPTAHGVGYSEMRLFDVKGTPVRTLERTGPGALQPVFSPDHKTLAVGNRNDVTQLFDVGTGKLLHSLGKRMTQEVAFSPDGRTLAAGYVDGTVALWDVATGKQLHSAPSGCKEVYSLDWSPKGDVLASSGRDGNIVLWDPGTLMKLKELDAPFWVIQVRFSADGSRLLTASAGDHGARTDRKITVWAVPGADR